MHSVNVPSWVAFHTKHAKSVVDLGAGRFDYLVQVADSVEERIGVELCEAYMGLATKDMVAIHGDMREWKSLVPENSRDVAMMIDTIEHIPKADGQKMLRELTSEFRKVLVFTPDGYMAQYSDVWGGDNVHQMHRSGWTAPELEAFGFRVTPDPGHHGERGGALLAVYERA